VKITKPKAEFRFLDGIEIRCVVANGLAYAKKVMQKVKDGKANYHFIEIMACPGGCLGGGGQPIPTNKEIRLKRKQAIYAEDMGMPLRKSHDNPEVKELYKDFLGKPLGHKSHELLHTHYTPRKRY
jgi:NADH-quinone oxidoreductase subunit G/[NiFe] hydrogenase diaphorase moiety small subunit/NADP-reducing hydrogenase subunit HndD